MKFITITSHTSNEVIDYTDFQVIAAALQELGIEIPMMNVSVETIGLVDTNYDLAIERIHFMGYKTAADPMILGDGEPETYSAYDPTPIKTQSELFPDGIELFAVQTLEKYIVPDHRPAFAYMYLTMTDPNFNMLVDEFMKKPYTKKIIYDGNQYNFTQSDWDEYPIGELMSTLKLQYGYPAFQGYQYFPATPLGAPIDYKNAVTAKHWLTERGMELAQNIVIYRKNRSTESSHRNVAVFVRFMMSFHRELLDFYLEKGYF